MEQQQPCIFLEAGGRVCVSHGRGAGRGLVSWGGGALVRPVSCRRPVRSWRGMARVAGPARGAPPPPSTDERHSKVESEFQGKTVKGFTVYKGSRFRVHGVQNVGFRV
jgi:hypothetical protein